MADNRPIGLFDSGVGGLSILLEIKKLMPSENAVFLADQKNIPYGEKSKSQLEDLSIKITKFLIKNHDIKLLVIACNTATCYVLESLRSKFKIPIIGTVPAIKPAVSMTKNGKVAILSTPATAKSSYLSSLIKTNAKNMMVLKIGCFGLEDAVENLKTEKIFKLLDIYLGKVKKFEADVIVLGCTHYPFLKKDIVKKTNGKIKVIDSGLAIAKRTRFILKQKNSLSHKRMKDFYYTTQNPKNFTKSGSFLLKSKIEVEKASL